jgi:hypothetical protein
VPTFPTAIIGLRLTAPVESVVLVVIIVDPPRGAMSESVAASTPGMARTRSSASWKKDSICVGFE